MDLANLITSDKALTLSTVVISSSLVSALVSQKMARNTNLRVENLKSRLEHGRSISKAQVEVELSVYRTLWESISNFVVLLNTFVAVRALATKMAPELRAGFVDEMVKVNFENLMEPQNRLASAVQNNQPFFSVSIYEKAIHFAARASSLYGDLLTSGEHDFYSAGWWAVRARWADEMTRDADAIAELIRSRMLEWQAGD